MISMNHQQILTIIPGIHDNTPLSQSRIGQSRIGQSTMKLSFNHLPLFKSSRPTVLNSRKTMIHSLLPMLCEGLTISYGGKHSVQKFKPQSQTIPGHSSIYPLDSKHFLSDGSVALNAILTTFLKNTKH